VDRRKQEILRMIIDEYIETAMPVGSRRISRTYPSSISPATVRNEMADLEELGYLIQPHTSAGRIPSNKAFRLYVDELMGHQYTVSREDAAAIERLFSQRVDELEQVFKKAAAVISHITRYPSVVLAPQMRRTVLRRIQLVPINSGLALVVIVTDKAVVKDAVIRIPEGITPNMLYHISESLTDRYAGHSLTDIDLNIMEGLQAEMARYRAFFKELSGILNDSVLEQHAEDVVMEGASNILNFPEYHDIDRVREFFSMMETREKLYPLLANRTRLEFTVTIGDENHDDALNDLSLVTVTYRVSGKPMGTLGVIGPVRMDYQRVFSVLDHIGRGLGEVISLYLSE